MKLSAHFRWMKSPFAFVSIEVVECELPPREIAIDLARFAIMLGYTKPTWREWWRWREAPLPFFDEAFAREKRDGA